ncbi:tRNA synthetases class I-domain-containing protein [Stachybotrys elegans]|uniref:Isoleucine--tRNA ligase, mitochondrial n=1 Tax=Stachybotrys elegans TaxID=80388 RepID=A0A8K0WSN7_9HYPO|nr:tRNA synthetases class I-domain-containing protein [Stachybotrys elegans]
MSWKNTLRLPKSKLPARPSISELDKLLPRCTTDFYEWQSKARPQSDPFVIHDGPPYANGPLHLGHALNKILKDMILRWQVQRGRRVVYRPSWDCHGLPIELKALKTKSARDLKPGVVRNIARDLAASTIAQQMKAFKSFAVAADWDNKWTTMDPDYEIRQLRVFQRMVQRGLIYRRRKPVYWSTSSVTALAEAELDYRDDHQSTAAYIKFPVTSDLSNFPGLSSLSGPLYAAIWTTTPWTLPANKAIGVHKEMGYSIIHADNCYILVAKSRVEVIQKFMPTAEVVVDSILGAELTGLEYRNKLRGKDSATQPIVHADFVTADSGTGLVHMAPGHGQIDYEACSALGIDAFAPITDDGFFTKEAYPEDPEKLTSAPSIIDGGGQVVLELMGDDVLKAHKLVHKYPYDWRTKKPVVIRATAQWFADVDSIKKAASEALDDVRFIPETGRGRLESFIKGRSEWCISRQRAWGVPIPALYDQNGEAFMTSESIDHIISVMETRGLQAWFTDEPDEPAWIPASLEGKYRRGTDTMDVWFDSGSSWSETGRPADIYLEGSDQHRGWFQSSLLTYIAATERESGSKPSAPFKTLITHGFTLDSEGKKMSKSIGNTISPESIMDGTLLCPPASVPKKTNGSKASGAADAGKGEGQPPKPQPTKRGKQQQAVYLGPDALRLWAASVDFTSDVQIGHTVMKPVESMLVKYRTILKMITGSLHKPEAKVPVTKLDAVALVQLEDLMAQVSRAYDNHEFYRAIGLINQWIATDFSAFYLEALKDRLYCGDGGGMLEPILVGLLRMLAPVVPVLVEETLQHAPEWVFKHRALPSPPKALYHDPIAQDIQLPIDRDQAREDLPKLQVVHTAVKAALERGRVEKALGSSLQCNVVIQFDCDATPGFFERWSGELSAVFVVSSVDINTPVSSEHPWVYVEEFELCGQKGSVHIIPPKDAKCPRCWKYQSKEEDHLCPGCSEQVSQQPEMAST